MMGVVRRLAYNNAWATLGTVLITREFLFKYEELVRCQCELGVSAVG